MDMGDNWQIHAPWAQLVASTVVPPNLFKNALEMTDKVYEDVNRDSAGESLAGQISNEYFVSEEQLIETGLDGVLYWEDYQILGNSSYQWNLEGIWIKNLKTLIKLLLEL